MGIVGRLDQYASMLAGEFDDYSMSENLFPWSETFTAGNGWIGGGTITLDSSIVDPSGNTGTVYYPTVSEWTRPFNGLGATTIALSFFTKIRPGGSGSTTRIQMYQETAIGEPSNVGLYDFNMTGSNPDSGRFTNITRTEYPNGWYRFTCKVISNSGAGSGTFTSTSRVDLEGGATTNYVWGIQVERGSVATDYTRTRGTAISRVLSETTNTNITGLSTYFSSGFSENVGVSTFLPANVFPPYDLVYDDFGGTLFGAGQGRYMRQNTDKSVIVYNEIDEVSDFRDIVRTGLVLDLDAAQPLSYKGTGTSWNDLSGSANNGTLVNTPTYNSSGYFDFDYLQSESVSFSNSSSIEFLNTSPYTLEAWVYPTRNPGANNFTGIFDRESNPGSGRDGYNIYFLGSATTDTFFFAERFVAGTNGNTSVTLNQSVSVNNWHHIVATYNGTTLTLYRNGSSVGTPATTTGNITNTSKSLTIGVRGGNYFGGRISNAKIYNRALSTQEITQNFNALKHRFGL